MSRGCDTCLRMIFELGLPKHHEPARCLLLVFATEFEKNVRLLLMQTIESNKFCCYHEAAFADAELPPLTKLFTSILINQLISVHLRVLGLDCSDVLVLQGFLRTLVFLASQVMHECSSWRQHDAKRRPVKIQHDPT